MQEHQRIIEDYFTIIDTKKITEKEKNQFFVDIILLYEDWFKIKGEDLKSVRHCKDKFLPILEKTIKKSSNDYLQTFYRQYMSSYAFCGRRDLECFIDYMESERPYRVLDSRRSVLMPFVDALNRLTFDKDLKMVCVSYPPSLGKCVDENTIIMTPKGYSKIKDINVDDIVCSMKDGEIVNKKVINKWNTIKKQVKITTSSGKTIIISPEHHMLTIDGYKSAKDLTVNDYFYSALFENKEILEVKEIDYDELFYITCMIFEGHCKKNRLSFTGEENELTIEFKKCCDRLGIEYYPQYRKGNKAISYRLRANNDDMSYKLLKKYKINDELCYSKRLPKEFFTMPLNQKYLFLSIMFATDGYIGQDTGVSLANEGLIDDIQNILNSCGIYSKKSFKKNNYANSWRLFITQEYVKELSKKCYAFHKNNRFLEFKDKTIRNNAVRYPFKLLEKLMPCGEKNGYPEILKFERKTDRTKKSFDRFVSFYPELKKEIYKDFFWEKICKIEHIDEEIKMVDIEVEDTHNFIANGFVSHNSFTLNYYTAFLMGMDKNNSVLRMSYSDELVNSCSRSIKDLLSNHLFSDIFNDFGIYNGKPFAKDKENEWKIKGADVITNHYARPRGGQITGVRANKAIILDDMTKGAEEATNSQIHKDLYIKWTTEILNRDDSRDGEVTTKFILAGTMWSPEDLLNKVREDEEKYYTLKPSKKYKFTWETDNAIFIRVPALDENDESTCPSVKTTEYYRQLREKVDPYFFACVYQQEPIAPTGLEFSYDIIRTYERLPLKDDGTPLYSNYAMASLDPARKGKDFVSMPIFVQSGEDHYMVDVLYQQKPMTDLYDEIIDKIIENKVIRFVIENNIDTSLKTLLEKKLKDRNYNICTISEKYSTVKKEDRIKNCRGIIRKNILFKDRNIVSRNTEYGKFMENFTNYSFDFVNKHDDAPDSLALYTSEIILGKGTVSSVQAIDRSVIGF